MQWRLQLPVLRGSLDHVWIFPRSLSAGRPDTAVPVTTKHQVKISPAVASVFFFFALCVCVCLFVVFFKLLTNIPHTTLIQLIHATADLPQSSKTNYSLVFSGNGREMFSRLTDFWNDLSLTYAQFSCYFSKMTLALYQLKRKQKVNQQAFFQLDFSISKIHS